MDEKADTNSSIEYEIKLDLGNLEQYQRLVSALGTPKEEINQSNYFFDTSESRLLKSKWALRIRISNNESTSESASELTLKGPQKGSLELSARNEISAGLPMSVATAAIAGGFDLTTLEVAPIIKMKEIIGEEKLIPLMSFTNKRLVFEPSRDIGCSLEVDLTTFGDKSVCYELEMEFAEQNEKLIAEATVYIREILDKLGIEYQPKAMSKFGTALAKGSLLS